MNRLDFSAIDENAMVELGKKLGLSLEDQALIFLEGELGAGKTTFTRGVLRSMGYQGAVKSPTYTLVEPYTLGENRRLYHFDLYRLADPEELEYMGIRDYLLPGSYSLVEWPIRGLGVLPDPDLHIHFQADRTDSRCREVEFSALNRRGSNILARMNTLGTQATY